MSERESLLEILQLLARAGCIDGKVFVRDGDTTIEVQAHGSPRPRDPKLPPTHRHLRLVA